MTDDGKRCGVMDAKNRHACVLDQGHEGMHSSGTGFVWKDTKPRKAAEKPIAKAKATTKKPAEQVIPCADIDAAGRACSKVAGHRGDHSNAAGWARVKPAKAPKSKPDNLAEVAVVAPHVCANAVRDASTGKPLKGPHAKACEREFGHDGPHRIGPHGDLEFVTEWVDDTPGCVSYNRKAQPPMTLDDEPEDPEADEAALAAMESESDDEPARAPSPATGTVFRNVKVGGRRVDLKAHPAADIFDMLEGEEYEQVKADIRANGLRHPPVLDATGDLVVDGRNRLRICQELGIEPTFENLPQNTDVIAYIISVNLRRRHQDESQRAMAADALASLEKGTNRHTLQTGKFAGLPTQAQAAKMLNVSERSVRDARKVRENAVPEVVKAVKQGKVAVSAAAQLAKLPAKKQREIHERVIAPSKGPVKGGKIRALAKQEEKREVVRKINTEQVAPAPIGPYRLIVADFPWPYDNSDQHEGSRGHIPYPAMPIDAGIALAVELDKLAHEDGCILAFWTTNAFMPDAVRMVEAWGFSWRTIFTWDKERDGIGTWGRGRTEHMIIAERGEVEAHTLNEVSTLLRAPRREHSRKPDEMMELLEQHCPGPWLEMFARAQRPNWATWGAETQKFATEAA